MDLKLGQELLAYIFSNEGLLGQALEGYEERIGQTAMADQILHAYLEDKIALTEAGTGIGKSLAYLAVAMLWTAKRQERTVISTHTIALQHQLIEKDIPFLQKTLELDLEATLVKGMQNYLCLRKLEEAEEAADLFATDESRRDFDRLRGWAGNATSGCRSSLPFSVSSQSWERFGAHADDCSSASCPHFRSCFFFQARRKAEESQLLVVNHHLLLTDLVVKADEQRVQEKTILPSFQRLVIDEAHHLEEVAFEVFSNHTDWIALIKLINRFFLYRDDPEGRTRILEKALEKSGQATHVLTIDLPAQKQEILRKLERAFNLLKQFIDQHCLQYERRLRVKLDWRNEAIWSDSVVPAFKDAADLIMKWVISWQALCALGSSEESVIGEILMLASRLEDRAKFILLFFDLDMDWKKYVRWIEFEEDKTIRLIEVSLDLAEKMRTVLFSPLRTTVLCSATLCQGQDFSFVKQRLGIEKDEGVNEAAFNSPFDYKNRTRFVVPNDLPEPTAKEFVQKAIDAVAALVQASQGGALVLFTSTEMLREACCSLMQRKELAEYLFLRQGELGRNALFTRFNESPKAVLLGVDSFWEGVDIPGDALRLVIIVKLPFHALQDPLVEALQEQISLKGGNPFYDYSVPKAVMKFKQGFGRLMRRKEDRGIVVCLDKRIFTKNYGKRFLKTLPNCEKVFLPMQELETMVSRFFGSDVKHI